MTVSTSAPPHVADAEGAAAAAAARAGVTVRELTEVADFAAASEALAAVWNTDADRPPVNKDLLRAFAQAGNYVAGAERDGQVVGVSVGFIGRDHRGGVYLHSHVSGVAPSAQSRHAGFALKQHQRAWALRAAITSVVWTFDPLVRRNGFFNLAKLGADAPAYFPNFYGEMQDGINSGDESDRCVARWDLTSARAAAAAHGKLAEPDIPALIDAGAVVLLAEGDDGAPVVGDGTADTLLCWVPEDIVAVRRSDRDLALRWRHALRDTLGSALGAAYVGCAMSRSGWYVLERRPSTDGAG